MATGMWRELNGVDEKLYERLNDEMNVYNDPPKGLLFHSAGPVQTGWGVFADRGTTMTAHDFRRIALGLVSRRAATSGR